MDAEVRDELDRWQREDAIEFVGDDRPRRYAATRAEALAALEWFVEHRLDGFGPHEDAMLADDGWMSHADGGVMATKPYAGGRSSIGVRRRLEGNPRMAQALRGLDRLADLDGVIAQERARGTAPP